MCGAEKGAGPGLQLTARGAAANRGDAWRAGEKGGRDEIDLKIRAGGEGRRPANVRGLSRPMKGVMGKGPRWCCRHRNR
jgi:hypothetical protein